MHILWLVIKKKQYLDLDDDPPWRACFWDGFLRAISHNVENPQETGRIGGTNHGFPQHVP